MQWSEERHKDVVFVETAIIYESGLDRIVSMEWEVIAPEEIRIERVMARNGLRADDVRSRIEAQKKGRLGVTQSLECEKIVNDGIQAVLPRIETLLQQLKNGNFL